MLDTAALDLLWRGYSWELFKEGPFSGDSIQKGSASLRLKCASFIVIYMWLCSVHFGGGCVKV